MDAKELASLLNGREYREEITKEEEQIAESNGLVVVFGYSDDNVEFRGAINDEVGAYEGTTILLDQDGIIEGCEEGCSHSQKAADKCRVIEAKWEDDGYTWSFETDIQHETFEILEDGEKFCRGIVFHISALSE